MKSYYINVNSNWRALLIGGVFFGLTLYLVTLIPNDWPDLVHFGAFAILFMTPPFISSILSRGKIRIELTEKSFKTIWIKRFFLSNEQDVELGWDRIIDYVHQENQGPDSFRMTLTNKQQFKFYRYSYFSQNDDFHEFLYHFPVFLQRVNSTNQRTIDQGITEYQTRSFRWVLIIISIIAVGLLINTLLYPETGSSMLKIGIIFSGILFYWSQATKK